MTRPSFRPAPYPALPAGGQKCYYWVCASIVMDADAGDDPGAIGRVHQALSCAQDDGCVRAADCREMTLAALARLLCQRGRE